MTEPVDLSKLIPEQQKKAVNDPSLKGAVALDNPLIVLLRTFTSQLVPFNPRAVFVIAIASDGRLLISGDGDGGPVQVLGMLTMAEHQIMNQLQSRRPPNSPV